MFHTLLYPNHELREFWRDGISFRAFVPSFLMVFAQTPGSIAAGLMLGDLLARLIPPARRAFDAEAQGFPGTSFQSAMRDLFGVLVWTLPIGLAIALAAAYSLESLR
jgi:hypothetical protein